MHYDYHTHSTFSDDGQSSQEDMVRAAISKGFAEIALTDHYDPDYADFPSWGINFNADKYNEHITLMQERYGDQIGVVRGLEIGMQTGSTLEKCSKTAKAHPYDFLLASVHVAEHHELACGTFFNGRSLVASFTAYYKFLYECVKNYSDFDVLAHINVLDRYAPSVPKYTDEMWDYIDEVFKMVISRGKGIEWNTSSFRKGMGNRTTPTYKMLERYRELGGEIITLGSDAHSVRELGDSFDFCEAKLKDLGFKYIATYRQHKPSFVTL